MAAPPNPRSLPWIDAHVLVMLAAALGLSFTKAESGRGRAWWDRRVADRPAAARLR